MKLLDGAALATRTKAEIAEQVASHVALGNRAPHLVAVLVGDHPASASYVRNKIKSCGEVGFRSTIERLDASVTQAELLALIARLNADAAVDGFIVQLPLPPHIDPDAVTLAIAPAKDVDGFHPMNFGRMAQGLDAYLPATPYGILQLLDRYGVVTSGKHAVVLGRSNIVGTPISILLSRKAKVGDATVTLCHSRTQDLPRVLASADILIAAIGHARLRHGRHGETRGRRHRRRHQPRRRRHSQTRLPTGRRCRFRGRERDVLRDHARARGRRTDDRRKPPSEHPTRRSRGGVQRSETTLRRERHDLLPLFVRRA